jgi:hypothetical protein
MILIAMAVAPIDSAVGGIASLAERHLEALGASVGLLGTAELDQRLLKVGQGSFDETVSFLEVLQKAVPQGMLRENLRVSEDDQTETSTSKGDIETTRIAQETDTLVVVGTHTR